MNPDRRARDVGRPVNAFDENRELIAAEPRDRVGSPHAVAESLTDGDQKLIAGSMAEGIVDVLEVIDVEQKHREGLAAGALRRVERVRDTIEEQRAVRKSGQRIVKRIVDELALRFALLGDIASDAGRAENAVLGAAQHGVVPKNDSLLAGAREDLHLDMCPDHAAPDVLEGDGEVGRFSRHQVSVVRAATEVGEGDRSGAHAQRGDLLKMMTWQMT